MAGYTQKVRERALAVYIASGSVTKAAKSCCAPESTVRRWIKNAERDGGLVAEMRDKKRAEFAENAWDVISVGVEILKREMYTALENADEFSDLVSRIGGCDDISDADRAAAVRALAHAVRPDMREISTALGTLYDKAALSRGEATGKQDFCVRIIEQSE